jgi:uncharacterized protein
MLRSAIPVPVWFVAALIAMLASQIVRLQQHEPGLWIFWDYIGRLAGLAILALVPAARAVAFRRDQVRIVMWKVALWIVGVVVADHYLGGWVRRTIDAALPATALGFYPQLSGWLYFVDLVFGLALVAYSEEILFRRCARHVFQLYLDDSRVMVFATSLLFGAYHWWTGVGNIVQATLAGILLMLFLQRSGALWPIVLCHYLADVIDFA